MRSVWRGGRPRRAQALRGTAFIRQSVVSGAGSSGVPRGFHCGCVALASRSMVLWLEDASG